MAYPTLLNLESDYDKTALLYTFCSRFDLYINTYTKTKTISYYIGISPSFIHKLVDIECPNTLTDFNFI